MHIDHLLNFVDAQLRPILMIGPKRRWLDAD